PDAALVDDVAAIVDRERILDARDMGGQVGVANQAAVLAAPGVDLFSDRSAVEIIGDESQAAFAILGRALFRADQAANRYCKVAMPRLLTAIEQGQGRLGSLGGGDSAVAIEGGEASVEHAGHGGGFDAFGGDAAGAFLEVFAGR